MRRAAKMTQLSIEETSGVDHPAHLREGWLVMKASDISGLPSATSRIVKENGPVDNNPKSRPAADEEWSEEKASPRRNWREELDKAYARIDELEKELSSMTSRGEDDSEDDEEEVDEEFMKAAPPAVARAFEKARQARREAVEKAAQLEAELTAERVAKADAAAVEKARQWAHLSLDAEQVGPALRRLGEMDEALAKSVTAVLDSVNAQAESADIFAEIGKSAPVESEGDAFARFQSLAKAAVEAGRASTVEQAMVDIAVSNPDLYREYLTQKGA